jgi:hypothetical protein
VGGIFFLGNDYVSQLSKDFKDLIRMSTRKEYKDELEIKKVDWDSKFEQYWDK